MQGIDIKISQKVLRGLENKETQPVRYFWSEGNVDEIKTEHKILEVCYTDMSLDALLDLDFIKKCRFLLIQKIVCSYQIDLGLFNSQVNVYTVSDTKKSRT